MRVLHSDGPVMDQMRDRRFHPDDDFVEGDGLDPRLECHVGLVCLVYLVVMVCLVDFDIRAFCRRNEPIIRFSLSERNTG
jgi:hypothetical protein